MKLRRWTRKASGESPHPAVWLAWSLSGLAAVLGGMALFLLVLNQANPEVSTYEYWGADTVLAVVFPVVGALIVSRHPANAVGWLLCIIGLSSGAGRFSSEYATYVLLTEPGPLSGGVAAAWVGSWVGDIAFFSLLVFVPLLFPDGRPPSRRWWPVVWLDAGLIALVVASTALMPGSLAGNPSITNPLGIERAGGVLGAFLDLGLALFLPIALASIVSLVWRYYRSRGEERQQLKWLTYVVAVILPLSLIGNDLFPKLAWLIGGVAMVSIPIAIGIAILRYRLYDIDLIINRTLVYGSLTIMLVALYFGGIVLLQRVFVVLTGQQSTLAVVASTLVIAALFTPLRSRLQSFIDRRFYRRKYDAAKTLAAFNSRLRDETELGTLSDDVVGVIRETMQPEHVSLWLRSDPANERQNRVASK